MQCNVSKLAGRCHSSLKGWVGTVALPLLFVIVGAQQSAMAEIAPVAKPMAVHVVCLARSNDILMKNSEALTFWLAGTGAYAKDLSTNLLRPSERTKLDEILKKSFPPVDAWSYLPLGTGFVIDNGQRHVITNWRVQEKCPKLASGQQIGILDPVSNGFRPILADVISKPPQSVCKNSTESCSSSESDNFRLYVHDIAVLKLVEKTSVQPFELDANPHLVGGQDVYLSGFPTVTSSLSQGMGGAARTLEVVPSIIKANFSREAGVSTMAPGVVKPITATLFELSGSIDSGNAGGPLISAERVVGVILTSLKSSDTKKASTDASSMGLAIRSNDVIEVLKANNVDYKKSGAATIVTGGSSVIPASGVVITDTPAKNNYLVFLLVGVVILAGGAFFVLNRKGTTAVAGGAGGAKNVTSPVTAATSTVPGAKVASAEIQGVYGDHASQSFPLPTPNGSNALVFGRDAGTCQVVFPHNTTSVSKFHCRVTWDAGRRSLLIEDNNSTNGTFVNKQRLTSGQIKPLSNGDVIHLGGTDSKNVFKVVYKFL